MKKAPIDKSAAYNKNNIRDALQNCRIFYASLVSRKKNRFVCRFMFIFVLHGECMYARDAITPNVQYRTKAFCMRLL